MKKLSDERIEEFNRLLPQARWDALVLEFGGPVATEHWNDIEARRAKAPKNVELPSEEPTEEVQPAKSPKAKKAKEE